MRYCEFDESECNGIFENDFELRMELAVENGCASTLSFSADSLSFI